MYRASGHIRLTLLSACLLAATTASLMGCPDGGHPPDPCECAKAASVNPADFVDVVDHPLFPLTPGTTFTYEGETDEGTERVVVHVTDATKEILGVTCTVVQDTVTLDGEVIEDTYDWYAQDVAGNVWYFGEASMSFEDGVGVSTFGSWEAGVLCAEPGIVMKATPQVGDVYRQEFFQCVAEDMARVLAVNDDVTVPFGVFGDCLRTEDFTPLDPEVLEEKLYAPGIGVIAVEKNGERKEELISITTDEE